MRTSLVELHKTMTTTHLYLHQAVSLGPKIKIPTVMTSTASCMLTFRSSYTLPQNHTETAGDPTHSIRIARTLYIFTGKIRKKRKKKRLPLNKKQQHTDKTTTTTANQPTNNNKDKH